MSVSTSVQLQIANILAHCTVEVMLDVPASAVLPHEATDFCSDVAAAVIHASNNAWNQNAVRIATLDVTKHQHQEVVLEEIEQHEAEHQEAVVPNAPASPLTALLKWTQPHSDANTGETPGPAVKPESAASAIRQRSALNADAGLGQQGLQHSISAPPSSQNVAQQFNRRVRHDSMEPEGNMPQAKKVKFDNENTHQGQPAHAPWQGSPKKKKKKSGKKGKGKGNQNQQAKGKLSRLVVWL